MDLDLTNPDQEISRDFILPTLLHSFFIRTSKFEPEAQTVYNFFFQIFGLKICFPSVLILPFQRKAIFSKYGDLFLKVKLAAMFCEHLQQ